MKKICLLLLALVAAVGVNASTWYLVGANYGWSDNAAYQFTPDENDANVQTLTVASLSGTIKIKEAGNSWGSSFGSNGSKLQEGVLYKAGYDGGNINVDGTIANATITINETAHTILVTGASQENDYSEVYLIGDFGGGWSETNTNYPLTLKEGTTNVYEGKYTLSASNNYFKMKAGAYVYGTGGDDISVVLGTTYTAKQSGNAFKIASGEYTFTFVLDKNADTGDLTVTTEAPVTYPETMHIIGWVNGGEWDPANYVALTAGEDGIFTATEVAIGGSDYGYFSFATNAGTAGAWNSLGQRYGATASDFEPTLGEACGIEPGDNAFKVRPGKYDFTLNFADMTLTLVASEVAEPLPTTLNIFGNVNGDTWNPTNYFAMTAAGEGLFGATEVAIGEDLGSGYGYLSFATGFGENDGDWAALGTRYGATANDFEPALSEAVAIVRGENAFKVRPGKYTISVDLNEMVVIFEAAEIITPQPVLEERDYTYDFIATESKYGMDFKPNNYKDLTTVLSDACEDLVATFKGDFRLWTDGVRMYAPASTADYATTLTIALPEGAEGAITKIEYTFKNTLGTNFVLTAPEGAELVANAKVGTWEGEASSVTLKYAATGNQAITGVKVYYTVKPEQPVVAPETLVLMGEVNGNIWAPDQGIEMTKDGNVFTATDVTINGTYSFATALGDSWDALNANTRWGAGADDVQLSVEPGNTAEAYLTAYEGYDASACKSFKAENGKYNVTVSFTSRGTLLKLEMIERIVEPNFVKVAEVKSGCKYVFYHEGTYNVDFAAQLGNKTYGYLNTTPVEAENGDEFYGNVANALTFTEVEGGWNIALANGTNLSNESGFKTLSTNQTDNEVWTISVAENGEATITNVATNGVIYLDTQYNSYGCYTTAPETGVLPVLYGLIAEQEEPVIEMPESLYIMGNINNENWNTTGLKMTKADNSFVAKKVVLTKPDETNNNAYFNFCTVNGANWDAVNSGDRYGAAESDQLFTVGSTEALTLYAANVNASACKSFMIAAGTYDITVTFTAEAAPMLTIIKSTDAIDAIDANEAAEVEYYNLQGVRVANPANGLYIRRQGNTATKVYIR